MDTYGESSKNKDFILKGIPASNGIAIGKVCVYKKNKPIIREEAIDPSQIDRHLNLFDEAKKIIETELLRLKKKKIDEISRDIISAQIEMVNDPELEAQVKRLIKEEHSSADFAIQRVFDSYLEMLDQSSNKVTRERMVDLKDIRDRLIQVANKSSLEPNIEPGSIVVAEDVSPREVIQFSDLDIKALVTDHGGQTSHASIMARSMGIPSVVGASRVCQLVEALGEMIVDGGEGIVIIDPTEELLEKYRSKIEQQKEEAERLQRIISEPSETRDGTPFKLRANIEFSEELSNIRKYGAEGIGLLRTESIYIRKEHFEDLEKQLAFYSEILENTEPHPVTIRLFDAGGDKFFSLNSEENNPFLGWRGIRMLLDERDLLRDQLRALLLVAGQFPGRVKILLPMISVIEEVLEVKEEMNTIQQDLKNEGRQVDESLEMGIMVEVPSVAIKADSFARHVDFFSIGTNDLTQYTLAVDRGNELISKLYQEVNPALFELIDNCVTASRRADIGIMVCGEIASYPKAALCLLGMGIGDLSMSPASIPKVKTLLKEYDLEQMQELAETILQAETTSQVNEILNSW